MYIFKSVCANYQQVLCVFNIFLDATSGENIIESLVSEGLVSVRQEGVRGSAELAHLVEIEATAKAAGKGKWASSGLQEHVRNIKWTVENPRQLVDKFKGKPIQAVVEHVRDGSTVRAFLLPDFYHITLMVSGVRVIINMTFLKAEYDLIFIFTFIFLILN